MTGNIKIIRLIIPALIIISIIAGSCSGRKSKTEHKNIITQKELVSILTDIYITDGLLSLPSISFKFSVKDSTITYIEVIEKYGYSKETMDRTMRYYFIKRPKKLIRIYDEVLSNLSEMESRYLNEPSSFRIPDENIWPREKDYYLPDPSGEDSTWLDIPVDFSGYYVLNFSLTLYPDDQSLNPRSGLYIYYPDKPDSLKKDYLTTLRFIKDGQNHNYKLSEIVSGTDSIRLRGWFVDYENRHPDMLKHVRIDNISFLRSRLK